MTGAIPRRRAKQSPSCSLRGRTRTAALVLGRHESRVQSGLRGRREPRAGGRGRGRIPDGLEYEFGSVPEILQLNVRSVSPTYSVRTVTYTLGMESERFEMRVPKALLGRIDAAKGHESRASFFRRAAVEKLNGSAILRGGEAPFPVSRKAEGVWTQEEVVSAFADQPSMPGLQVASALVESGGCPECGGLWQRRPDVPGRFCVDCGGREAK